MTNFYFINENNVEMIAMIALAISLVSLIISLILFLQNRKNNQKLKLLFRGKKGKDLEQIILDNNDKIEHFDKEIQELFDISNRINKLAGKGLSRFKVVRFNPFKDLGGDQSFVAAFLDSQDNGLVISSMHTREGTRVYSKPIIKGESEKYKLTDEEVKAIEMAKETS